MRLDISNAVRSPRTVVVTQLVDWQHAVQNHVRSQAHEAREHKSRAVTQRDAVREFESLAQTIACEYH